MTAFAINEYRGLFLALCLCLSACGLPYKPPGCHVAVRHAIYGRNECVIQSI